MPWPLLKAHAHNDYLHERPLLDALEHGFASIEADVHLMDGELYVAHDKEQIVTTRTLRSMYLEPLRSRVKRNGGYVYGKQTPITLLVDIKSDADPTYLVLRDLLKQFADILTIYKSDKQIRGQVNVVISGNRPLERMEKEEVRYAACDGRLTDLGSGISQSLIPMVSDNWEERFAWRGAGPFPAEEREKLKEIVGKAHAQGRQVRFWTTDVDSPQDQLNLWKELLHADVDLIGTDKLEALREFLLNHGESTGKPRGETHGK